MRRGCCIFTMGVLFALASPAVGQTTQAEQEACGDPRNCYVDLQVGHSNQGPGGSRANMHGPCYKCVVDWDTCHPSCETAAMDADERSAYRGMLAAARTGKISEVIQASANAKDYIHINHERMSLQITSCTGDALVANLPLNSAEYRLAVQLLPTSSVHVAVR